MLIQTLINGFVAASMYLLIGIGFAYIYNTVRFFNIAHGVIFTSGSYFLYFFTVLVGLPLNLSIILSIILSTILGCLTEILVFRKLRRNGATSLMLFLSSLGIYIVLQNVISILFGDDVQTIRFGLIQEGLNVFGGRITHIQVITITVSLCLTVAVAVFLKKTKAGRAVRAVANDPELANLSGIDSDSVYLITFAIGSFLAGTAGVLVALDVDMVPSMGLNILLMGMVAVLIGGMRSMIGIVLGALLLGMAQHIGVWSINSKWQNTIAFIILLIFLLFKPEGFMGKKIRKVEV